MKLPFPALASLVLILAGGAARADPVVQPPQVIEQAAPIYPEALRRAGISGQVLVQFGVDATGAVQNVKAVKSDHSELEGPATDAVRKFRFRPATKDGQPVAIRLMQIPITFNIPATAFATFPSFNAALKQAGDEHKIILIDFFTTWCEPCKQLDHETWADPAVIALLREKALSIKIDAEKNVELARHYGVTAYPTIALIRPDGTRLEALIGFRDAATFSGEFTAALAGHTKLGRAREAVAAAGADPEALVKARYALGQALAADGQSAEALTEFLWCFDEGMLPPSSYFGVRASFLLQDIASLGANYPPALDALKSRRDADRNKLLTDALAVRDFAAINHYLGDNISTLDEFDHLPEGSPARGQMGYWVFDLLLQERRYRDAAAIQPLDQYRHSSAAMRAEPVQNDSIRDYIAEADAREIEALAGAGQLKDARDLLKTLLDFDHSDTTLTAVTVHLARAGHPELAPKVDAGHPPRAL